MMKKNNTKKNRTARKLLPAAGMLAVSASMLATSTYAWFTMNKEVQVNGLAMRTKVSSNLLISSNNEEGTYKADTLVEGRKALLEPVSSNSANTGDFFYTLDAAEDGSKAHGLTGTGAVTYDAYNETATGNATAAAAGKYKHDAAFNTAYGIDPAATDFGTAYGYIDYVFYLKATGTADDQEIRMTKCDLDMAANYSAETLSYGALGTGDNAWRVALFATQLTEDQAGKGNSGENGAAVGQIDPAASGKSAKCILKTASAAYFNGTAADTASTKAAVTTGSGLIDTIDSGETKYYKVLVRVWLEGEDTSCNSKTYAALQDGQWKLDLDFWLAESGAESVTVGNETINVKAATTITGNTWNATKTPTQTADTDPIEVVTAAPSGG
ncbi:hypothetical protein [Ruminococcus flavefaciens]|uniref:SipW-cognate class signal peptide n=1 Tax=Ruminococcus flavefaciens TaxID=1265 RepID=A0A1M7K3J2_RUMFL|nr:hypothetical protein [Ruminococcus flavefaciens]SHM59731.1 hypothetical protein SAMN04487860_10779 [Ruminococcus flavefaciens]